MMKSHPHIIRKGLNNLPFPECKYWILDTDAGGDDTQAIILLISMAKKYDKIILGITCVDGNAFLDDIAKNVLIALTICQAKIPIYLGAERGLLGSSSKDYFFQKDGFGGKQAQYLEQIGTKLDYSLIKSKKAYQFLIQQSSKYKNDIGIITIGPLTNLAIAYYVNQAICENVKAVFMMGGNYTGMGLGQTFSSQFNVQLDAEAAYIVFKKFKNIHIASLEALFDIDQNQLLPLFTSNTTPKAKLVCDIYQLLVKVGKAGVCDPLAVIAALLPSACQQIYQVKTEIILSGKRTKGYCSIDWWGDYTDQQCRDGIVRFIGYFDTRKTYDEILDSYK